MRSSLLTPGFLRRLELLRIRSRRSFLGGRQGGHISPKRGHGIEFSDYRKYELGDNPRHIDWGVYGRTDRLYVKRFQEEQNLNVVVLVDTSPSLRALPEDGTWNLATGTAIALAYVALMNQDSVLIGTLSGQTSPKFSGAKAIGRVDEFLHNLPAHHSEEPGTEMARCLARIRFPGVVVVLSDFLFSLSEVEKMCTAVLSKNFDATFVHILGANDLNPYPMSEGVFVRDSEDNREMFLGLSSSERKKYEEALRLHCDQIRDLCGRCGIRYVEAFAVSQPEQFVLEELPRSGVFR